MWSGYENDLPVTGDLGGDSGRSTLAARDRGTPWQGRRLGSDGTARRTPGLDSGRLSQS